MSLNKVKLSGTSISLSRLSFGTASLHHIPTSSGRKSLLAAAIDCGFTHFDTAPLYGFGLAETELGRCLKLSAGEITVASKIGLYPPKRIENSVFELWSRKVLGKLVPTLSKSVIDWSELRANKSLEQSLKALKRDHLDILFLHAPVASIINEEEVLSWLSKQRASGKIRYWGVAGELNPIETWLSDQSELCRIVQTRDSAPAFDRIGQLEQPKPALITYGAISNAQHESTSPSVNQLISNALKRNPDGSVLVSSNKISHVEALAGITV